MKRADVLKYKNLDKVIKKYKNVEGANMPILQDAQEIFGYLSFDVMNYISEHIDISVEKLYSIATFYSQFRFKPVGKYKISLCLGTVCYVKGSGIILDEITRILGIKNGECTSNGLFSLDTTRCLGCCGMAPVIMINDDVYGNVTKDKVKSILEKYK